MSAHTAAAGPRPSPAAPREYRFPVFERHTLENGLRIIVAPVAKLPLVTVFALVEAGAAVEPPAQAGVAALSVRLLLEGAAGMNGAELSERFERIGASVDAHADWDVASLSLTTLSERLPEALALVGDLLRAPDFPEREIERLREERLAELLQQRTEPRGLADEQFAQALYEPSARYARPQDGDAASVRAITGEQVRAFYSARYQPPGVTLIFAGDVTMARALELTRTLFGNWTGTPVAPPASAVDATLPGRSLRIVAKEDAPQSEVRVGHLGASRTTLDYFDVVVMNAVLGGLFSSRINLNLREAHGYTYGAHSEFDWRLGTGPFLVSTAVKSEVTGDAVREILGEIERIRSTPIAEDELTLATSFLDGVFPIRYETTAAIASALANLVIHRLPDRYYDDYRARVRAVTVEGVLRAAQAHLHPESLRVVVVGDPAAIAGSVSDAVGFAATVVSLEGRELNA